MLSYIFRRLLSAIPFIFLVSLTVFILIQLPPGDFVDSWAAALSNSGEVVDAAQMAQKRHEFGLDQNIFVQYLHWMSDIIFHGNFGYSFEWNSPVSELIGERMNLTLILSLATLVLTWTIALPIGIYSAVRKYSVFDYVLTFLGFIGLAVPPFLIALIMLYIGVKHWDVNLSGLFSSEFANAPWSMDRVMDLMHHLWIPVIILGLSSTASLIRIMRANLIDQLYMPYVVTARAKGLSEVKLLLKYPVRIALNPFVSTIGFILPHLISGAVILSIVMNLPTAGPMLYQSLLTQDVYLSGALLLLLCLLTVVGTLISDILLVILDPRIRLE
ncbi:MAG TPA: ABC transporter permease [Rhodocyclaceae bacterium]|nr:ABC transporter permease [Rhodocyclaceae bacterium]